MTWQNGILILCGMTTSIPAREAAFVAAMRRHREAKGLTQEGLARAADVSIHSIVSLEFGRRRLRMDEALRIADALDVPLDEMLGESAA